MTKKIVLKWISRVTCPSHNCHDDCYCCYERHKSPPNRNQHKAIAVKSVSPLGNRSTYRPVSAEMANKVNRIALEMKGNYDRRQKG